MPVAVTDADGALGRALVAMLAERGGEVRATVRDPAHAESLRALGAKVARTDLTDPGVLRALLGDAHTICHLTDDPFVPDEAQEALHLGTTLALLRAGSRWGIRRFLLLSRAGASAGDPNPYLRAKGAAEEAVVGSGLEHLVLRTTHRVSPGARWVGALIRPGRLASVVVGDGTQRLAPVAADDVARVLLAADDRATAVAGILALQGPEVLTADALARRLGHRRLRHAAPDPVRAARPGVSAAALDLLSRDSLADAPDARREFEVPLTPLSMVLSV